MTQSTPLPVKIISWVMLLGGISSLIMTAPAFFADLGKNGIVLGLGYINNLIDIGLIITSFGISNMRRWALYAFTGLTVIGATVSVYSYFYIVIPNMKVIALISLGIDVLMMIYLWKISKMFK